MNDISTGQSQTSFKPLQPILSQGAGFLGIQVPSQSEHPYRLSSYFWMHSENVIHNMFYQSHSPDVVRRGNVMEYYSYGFGRGSNGERTLKVTLLGYKVMEEKTQFTVYKILVKRAPDESWHIFRRYADFSRLHDKLKEMFPLFNFVLPPKRWFRNFSAEFLEERQLGLQDFLQNLVAHKDVQNSEAVREFLCLDDRPTAFDSIRDRWAFCETLGGTNCCLQRDLMDDGRETESLRNVLLHKELQISQPERTKKTQEELNRDPRDVLTAHKYKEVERDDLRRPNKSSELGFIRSHGACWCGSATDSPEKHRFYRDFIGHLSKTHTWTIAAKVVTSLARNVENVSVDQHDLSGEPG